MAKKTATNPKGSGRDKLADRSAIRDPFWTTFRRSTIKNMGGKAKLRQIIVDHVEELERLKLAETLKK